MDSGLVLRLVLDFVVELLLIVWPGLYNSAEPALIGIRFFYWYQMLIVVVGAVLTAIVYFATRPSA